MAVIGAGPVSGVPSEQLGSLLQDLSTVGICPPWSVWLIQMNTVQLTPAPQRKADSAFHLFLSSVPVSTRCSAFCLLWPSSSVYLWIRFFYSSLPCEPYAHLIPFLHLLCFCIPPPCDLALVYNRVPSGQILCKRLADGSKFPVFGIFQPQNKTDTALECDGVDPC